MTDKQIIIDGVDVSECEYYDKNKQLLTCVCEKYPCSECHDCYYKQLKHKEQELQGAMDNYVQLDLQRVKEYNELVDLYKAKEQECKNYKQALEDIEKIANKQRKF